MSFAEVRLNDGLILLGTIGGPTFSTDVVEVSSGAEFRNQNWSADRGEWDLGDRIVTRDELDTLIAFFRARRGRAQAFRWRDLADDLVTAAQGVLTGTAGGPVYQLAKRYAPGADQQDRAIRKPVAAGLVITRAGVAAVAGSGAGQYALDDTTGVVTWVPDVSRAIAGITRANPAVITTTAAHGFTNGQTVWVSGVAGMTQINARAVTVAGVTSTTFQCAGLDASAFTAYTSGGTAARYPQPAEALAWSGSFDVPVRFDTDRLRYRPDAHESAARGLFYLESLPLREVRV